MAASLSAASRPTSPRARLWHRQAGRWTHASPRSCSRARPSTSPATPAARPRWAAPTRSTTASSSGACQQRQQPALQQRRRLPVHADRGRNTEHSVDRADRGATSPRAPQNRHQPDLRRHRLHRHCTQFRPPRRRACARTSDGIGVNSGCRRRRRQHHRWQSRDAGAAFRHRCQPYGVENVVIDADNEQQPGRLGGADLHRVPHRWPHAGPLLQQLRGCRDGAGGIQQHRHASRSPPTAMPTPASPR